MTFRLDVLTRDVAGFRNDFSHFIERSGHRACSFLDAYGAATATAPARPIAPGPSRSGMPRIANDVGKFNGGFRQGGLASACAVAPIAPGGRRVIGTCSLECFGRRFA